MYEKEVMLVFKKHSDGLVNPFLAHQNTTANECAELEVLLFLKRTVGIRHILLH